MILVTGGTGLVGSHLLYQLINLNNDIIAVYRSKEKVEKTEALFTSFSKNTKNKLSKITWIKTDIIDVPALEKIFKTYKISFVYHCAALVSFNREEYKIMRKINIEGTANIVNLCINFNIKKLCYVSSIATLDETKNNLITEDNHWNKELKHSEYAITKHGGEMEIWRASQENIDTIIVNPGVIFGVAPNTTESTKFFTQVKRGIPFYTEGVTGFVGVNDVVKCMITLMNSNITNERFILVSENKSYREILTTIAQEIKIKKPYLKINKSITTLFFYFEWLKHKLTKIPPRITKSTAKSAHNINFYSSEKFKKTFPETEFKEIKLVIKEICAKQKKELRH